MPADSEKNIDNQVDRNYIGNFVLSAVHSFYEAASNLIGNKPN